MDPELHQALQRLEDKVDGVDDKIESFVREQGPRMAVLDHRVGQLEAQRERKWAVWLALITALLALVGSYLQPMIVR